MKSLRKWRQERLSKPGYVRLAKAIDEGDHGEITNALEELSAFTHLPRARYQTHLGSREIDPVLYASVMESIAPQEMKARARQTLDFVTSLANDGRFPAWTIEQKSNEMAQTMTEMARGPGEQQVAEDRLVQLLDQGAFLKLPRTAAYPHGVSPDAKPATIQDWVDVCGFPKSTMERIENQAQINRERYEAILDSNVQASHQKKAGWAA